MFVYELRYIFQFSEQKPDVRLILGGRDFGCTEPYSVSKLSMQYEQFRKLSHVKNDFQKRNILWYIYILQCGILNKVFSRG